MKRSILMVALITLSVLTGCGGTNKSNAGVSMACASVESYLDTKALVLSNIGAGISDPVTDVQGFVGDFPVNGKTGLEIKKKYLDAMINWANNVSDALKSSNSESGITSAAKILESDIDSIEPLCVNNGWKFASGWRG